MAYLCLLAVCVMVILQVIRAFKPIASPTKVRTFCSTSRLGVTKQGGRSKADRAAGVGRDSDGKKMRHRDRDETDSRTPMFQEFVKPRGGGRKDVPVFLDDVPLSGDTGSRQSGGGRPSQNRRGSSSSGSSNAWAGGSHNDNQGQQSDPWKVLVRKLDASKSNTKYGKTEVANNKAMIDKNTPDEMQCSHFSVCSGCSIRGNFELTNIVNRAKMFFQSENIPMEVHLGDHQGWRTHVKLAVQPMSRWGGLKIGLYKEGSHEVCDFKMLFLYMVDICVSF